MTSLIFSTLMLCCLWIRSTGSMYTFPLKMTNMSLCYNKLMQSNLTSFSGLINDDLFWWMIFLSCLYSLSTLTDWDTSESLMYSERSSLANFIAISFEQILSLSINNALYRLEWVPSKVSKLSLMICLKWNVSLCWRSKLNEVMHWEMYFVSADIGPE